MEDKCAVFFQSHGSLMTKGLEDADKKRREKSRKKGNQLKNKKPML